MLEKDCDILVFRFTKNPSNSQVSQGQGLSAVAFDGSQMNLLWIFRYPSHVWIEGDDRTFSTVPIDIGNKSLFAYE